jgi:hypothetical protein
VGASLSWGNSFGKAWGVSFGRGDIVDTLAGGGGEDSRSSRRKRNRIKRLGFTNERAILEASLAARQAKNELDALSENKVDVAQKPAESINDYLNEKGEAQALQAQLDKLLSQLSVKDVNDTNNLNYSVDAEAAKKEIQEFLDDNREAIEVLLLDEQKNNRLLLTIMGF